MPLTESGIDESVLAYYNSLGVAERAQFRDTLGGPEREQFVLSEREREQFEREQFVLSRLGQGLAPGVDAEGADAAQGVELSLEPAALGVRDHSFPGLESNASALQQQTPQSDTMSDFPGEDLKQACGEDWCIKTCGSVTCIVIILIVVLIPCSLDKVSSEQAAIGYVTIRPSHLCHRLRHKHILDTI